MKTKIEVKPLTPTQRARMLRWILALEGKGERQYEQTSDMLRNVSDEDGGVPGFCCLGVACDVYDPKMWIIAGVDDAPATYLGVDTQLPQEVADWYGVVDTDPWLTGPALIEGRVIMQGGRNDKVKPGQQITTRASTWNDQQNATFAQIAAMLRENYGIHEGEEP